MLPTELIATAGNALVTAMMTDGWEVARRQVAQWFGRGENREADAALEKLDQSHAALVGLVDVSLERARTEQEIIWRTRFGDLLERYPDAEEQLRGLVAEIQNRAVSSMGRVEQNVIGFDKAQQAVQGHGVQNVTFGRRNEPRVGG
jgi:hypothetical protein